MDFLKSWTKKILRFHPQCEKDLPSEQQIPKYVLLEILNDLLWHEKRKGAEKRLRAIIKKLPKAIVMTLGPANFRAVIFEIIQGKQIAQIQAHDFTWRHPKEKNVPLEKIPLIKELLNGQNETYISHPADHPWTTEMRQLIHDQQINAIFAIPILVDSKTFILVIDATGKQQDINEEIKCYLRRIAFRIKEIEQKLLYFQKIKGREKVQRHDSSNAILFLGEIVIDSLRNNVFAVGCLSRRIVKNSPCQKSEAVLKKIQEMEDTLNIIGQVLHDIKMGEKINMEYFQINQILSLLSFAGIICQPAPTLKIYSDRRKLEKLLDRIAGLLQEKNKNPVCLSIKDRPFSWRFVFKQGELNTASLKKILRIAKTGETIGFKIKNLPLICSVNLLTQELGGEILIGEKNVIVKIPKEF